MPLSRRRALALAAFVLLCMLLLLSENLSLGGYWLKQEHNDHVEMVEERLPLGPVQSMETQRYIVQTEGGGDGDGDGEETEIGDNDDEDEGGGGEGDITSLAASGKRKAPPKGTKDTRTRVCAVALNPRQGSLFRTNMLGWVGSGNYRYVVRKTCPWDWPRVRLISYVKCCESLSKVQRSINVASNEYDIIIVTGDEYCAVDNPRAHFRQYHGTQIMAKTRNVTVIKNWTPNHRMQDGNGTRFPLFIPLGPRTEFMEKRIRAAEILPAAKRTFLYNFLGSMTSYSRQILKRVLLTDLGTPENAKKFPASVHITDRWHIKVTKSNGYVEPDEYRTILLDSVFTLCPTGHNPEAYRIYEALEAGSIPILAFDKWYDQASCDSAFKPFRDAGAPFIYLNGGWRQLQAFLERRGTNQTWVKSRQLACMQWYRWWMRQTALRFEALLQQRFAKRMLGPAIPQSASLEELEDEEDELEAVRREEEEDGEDETVIREGDDKDDAEDAG